MGHYLSEMYPNGYEAEQQRASERQKQQEERQSSRYARERELMEISGVELPQAELRKRINAMLRRYDRITSLIPAPITLHLNDGGVQWSISGSLNYGGKGTITMLREDYGDEGEQFELSTISGKGAEATHVESGLMEISMTSKNSEREIKPAEELFDRLISPLEIAMGIKPAEKGVVYQA